MSESKKTSLTERANDNVATIYGTMDEYATAYSSKRRFLLFKRDPVKARLKYQELVREEEEQLAKSAKRQLILDYPDPAKNKKMKAFVRIARKGYSELVKCKELDAETIEVKIDGEKKLVYTGVKPKIERLPASMLPGLKGRLLGMPAVFIRAHFMRWGEPFTRDEFTGEILEEQKMIAVLVEKEFFTETDKLDEHGRPYYEPNPEKVDVNIYKPGGFTIYDVSHIDFIAAEVGSIYKSKLLQKYWQEAKRIGGAVSDWLPWIVICIIVLAAMYFISGGI